MNQQTLVFCCLVVAVTAARQQQQTKISLEDIESENTPKRTKQAAQKIANPAKSPTQFGFVPTKTLNDYLRNDPKYPYSDFQQHSSPATGKVGSPRQKYNTQSVVYTPSSQGGVQSQKYTVPQQQAYTISLSPEQQTQYQQYEGVQYVADNSISGGQTDLQQYYNPQYVYLQQYSSPSAPVQSVVDSKGGVQYVMYVPVADQSQTYSNVAYTDDSASQQPQSYQADSYQTPEEFQTQKLVYSTQSSDQGASYQQPQQQTQYVQQKYVKNENAYRREPKSLLDSYVPSYLQLQYYNQARQNAIRDTVKVPQVFSGKDYSAESSVVSSRYSQPNSATSYVNYNYRPSVYRH